MSTRNYSNSTVEVLEAMNTGFRVETSNINAHTGATPVMFHQSTTSLFNVYGVIRINALFGECTTVFSADACKGRFTFTTTLPAAIAEANMSADTAVLTSLAAGKRMTMVGDVVGTAAVITASAGISFWPTGKLVVGTIGGTGVIKLNADGAAVDLTTGAMQFCICYTPLSDGAYVTAAI